MNTLAQQQMTQERRSASVPASRMAKRVTSVFESVFATVFGGMGAMVICMHALCTWTKTGTTKKSRSESHGITRSGNSKSNQYSIIRGSNPRYAGGTVTA